MAENIKISALNELVSGSINGTTVVPVVDGGVTLKAQLSSIKAFTNSDVATDTELANQASAINNTINALSTDDISEGSNKYYTDAKVLAEINSQGVLSGSLPASFNLDVGGVSNVDNITFTGATVTDNGSGNVGVSINAAALAVDDGITTVSSVDSITFSGATVTDDGTGDTTVTIATPDSLNVNSVTGDDVDGVTKITFEGGDVVDVGSGEVTVTISGGGTDVSALNTFTGSINSRVTTIEGLEIDNTSLNTFTGSFSSSVEGRVTTLESSGGSIDGAISGSQQISELGFVSSSRKFISDTITISSASIDGDITLSVAAGPGGGDGDVSFNNNYHIISQSIADGSDTNLQLSNIKIGTGINDFKFINFSESLDSRFGAGGGADFINDVSIQNGVITFAGTGNAFSADVPLPNGTISGSVQLTELGVALSGDINEAYIKQRLPDGSVSSSQQLSDFGFATNQSTSSFANKDAITGSFSLLSASLSDRIGTGGITEARLGEVTESMLNGGSSDSNGGVITLVSSSQQITYSSISDNPYFIGNDITITSGSDGDNIPYFNIDAITNQTILEHTASISSSVDTLVIASGSISTRLDSLEVGSDGTRVQNLENLSGSINNSINELNTFTGSFSSSVAQRIDDVAGGGAGADYISNVVWSEPNLVFTGQGSGFNGNVNIASVSGSGIQEYEFTPISESFASRIDALGTGGGATELEELSDVGNITVDIMDGDILRWVAAEQEFTHSHDLSGDYKITGSLDVTGSIISNTISASVITADSFIAGDVGTPTLSAAVDLEIDAGNSISLTSGINGTFLSSSGEIRIQNLLTIDKTIGDSISTPLTGSIMNSGSVDDDTKLWFFNGTEWKEIAFV